MRRVICGISRLDLQTRLLNVRSPAQVSACTLRRAFSHAGPKLQADIAAGPDTATILNSIRHAREKQYDDKDFLARSCRYGILSMQDLKKQASCSDTATSTYEFLIDKDEFRSDVDLWHLLLDYRVQNYGIQGVTTIWWSMTFRGRRIDLSSEDPRITELWLKMLSVSAEVGDLKMLKLLCEARGLARSRSHLFAEVVGTLLRYGRSDEAVKMLDRLPLAVDGIADMARVYEIFRPQGPTEFKHFTKVYEAVRPNKMYDAVVGRLLGEGCHEDAFLLHNFLIQHNDLPFTFDSIRTFLAHLASTSEDPGSFLRKLSYAGASFSGQGRHAWNLERQSPGAASTNFRPNKISDSWAAKAFATRALSFEFVLESLQAFGLTEIGPQSIRVLGLSSDLDTFTSRLAKLDELGIDTGSTTYSRIVRKLCYAREDSLLRQVLQTDMHHDVFDDEALLRRLLRDHLHRAEWSQVNLLLAVLNNGDTTALRPNLRYDLLSVNVSEPRVLLGMLTTAPASIGRLDHQRRHVLATRLMRKLRTIGKGHAQRPVRLSLARLFAGVMQDTVVAGGTYAPLLWARLFASLGQMGALNDVLGLSQWLINTPHQELLTSIGPDKQWKDGGRDVHVRFTNGVFGYKYQAALMHWSMKRTLYTNKLSERDMWRKTLLFLKRFEQEHCITIHLANLRKVIVMRCRSVIFQRPPHPHIPDPLGFCIDIVKYMQELWPQTPYQRRAVLDLVIRTAKKHKRRKCRRAIRMASRNREMRIPTG